MNLHQELMRTGISNLTNADNPKFFYKNKLVFPVIFHAVPVSNT